MDPVPAKYTLFDLCWILKTLQSPIITWASFWTVISPDLILTFSINVIPLLVALVVGSIFNATFWLLSSFPNILTLLIDPVCPAIVIALLLSIVVE